MLFSSPRTVVPSTPPPSLLPYLPLLFHSSSLSLSALPLLIHHPKLQVSLILLRNMPSFIKCGTHTHSHSYIWVCLDRQLQVCACVPREQCCNSTLLFFCRLECLGLGLPYHTKPVPQPGPRSKHQQIWDVSRRLSDPTNNYVPLLIGWLTNLFGIVFVRPTAKSVINPPHF